MNESFLLKKKKATVPADPYFNKVVLLINMDTPEFLDYMGNPLTPNGAVAVSNAQSPYGGYSMAMTGGYLSAPDNQSFWPNNLDFTLEVCVYQTVRAGRQSLFGQANVGAYTNGTFDFNMNGGAVSGNLHGNNANNGSITSPSVIPLNTWYWVCYERFGDTYHAYQNGIKMVSGTGVAGAIAVNSTFNFCIGATPNGLNPFNGYLGPMRYTNGVSRYKSANYTPPTGYFATH